MGECTREERSGRSGMLDEEDEGDMAREASSRWMGSHPSKLPPLTGSPTSRGLGALREMAESRSSWMRSRLPWLQARCRGVRWCRFLSC